MEPRTMARRRKWPVAFAGVAMGLLILGCATPYKTKGALSGGYSDYRISESEFVVTFRANSTTHPETVDKYLLRRASELALENGFSYLVVSSERDRTKAGSLGYSGTKLPIVTPAGTIRIRCFHEKPADEDEAISAADFLRYNYPEALQAITDRGD